MATAGARLDADRVGLGWLWHSATYSRVRNCGSDVDANLTDGCSFTNGASAGSRNRHGDTHSGTDWKIQGEWPVTVHRVPRNWLADDPAGARRGCLGSGDAGPPGETR